MVVIKCPHCGAEDEFEVEQVSDIDVVNNTIAAQASCLCCEKTFFIDWDLANPKASAL